MSIHVWKARAKAASMGAYAGDPSAAALWELSKRELVEVAMRLAVQTTQDDTPEGATAGVLAELATLRGQKIV